MQPTENYEHVTNIYSMHLKENPGGSREKDISVSHQSPHDEVKEKYFFDWPFLQIAEGRLTFSLISSTQLRTGRKETFVYQSNTSEN